MPSVTSTVFLSTLFLGALTSAQLLDFSPAGLPLCAQTCTTLANANSACLPAGDQQACLCQSSSLRSLYTTSEGVCDLFCLTSAERVAVQSWYLSLCQNGLPVTTATGTASASAAGPTQTDAGGVLPTDTVVDENGDGVSTTAEAAPTGSPEEESAFEEAIANDGIDATRDYEGSWWSAHWQWILMVIIISIAIIVGFVGGFWLKRRHDRKKEAKARELAQPVVWGPHQNQDATKGYSYPNMAEAGRAPPVVPATGGGTAGMVGGSNSGAGPSGSCGRKGKSRLGEVVRETDDEDVEKGKAGMMGKKLKRAMNRG